MKYKIINHTNKHYNYFYNEELLKLKIKSLLRWFSFKNFDMLFLFKKFTIKKLKSKCFIRNHCIISGRYRGLNNKLNLSRLEIRNISSLRLFSGLRKINW